jgi:hypothetical protein
MWTNVYVFTAPTCRGRLREAGCGRRRGEHGTRQGLCPRPSGPRGYFAERIHPHLNSEAFVQLVQRLAQDVQLLQAFLLPRRRREQCRDHPTVHTALGARADPAATRPRQPRHPRALVGATAALQRRRRRRRLCSRRCGQLLLGGLVGLPLPEYRLGLLRGRTVAEC